MCRKEDKIYSGKFRERKLIIVVKKRIEKGIGKRIVEILDKKIE